MSDTPQTQHGIIAWFARNSVAANLLMAVIIFLGVYSALTIQREMQPKFSLNRIQVTMAYPGAAPEEVEQGILLKIEEALKDVDAIKRLDATANESVGTLTLELQEGYDVLAVLDEVKSAVDGITSFPEGTEKAVIKELEYQSFVMNLQLLGDLNEMDMKHLAEQVRDELLTDPNIARAVMFGTRDYEIAIEIPEPILRKYHLTLDQVAMAIRNTSFDMPGGAIKTDSGNIMVRTKGQAYRQKDFEKIVLITYPDGTRLTLGDIATIDDGFVEVEGFSLFDQRTSATVAIYAVGNQDLITISEAVKKYIAQKQPQLPDGVELTYWADSSFYLEGRLELMLENLALGALLVFIVLGLFLDLKLAFWVMAGLPVCFLGALALMPLELTSVTLNMISLFGFILVLGIVVDDAIIIGESSYTSIEQYGHSTDSVIHGTQRVAKPATFGVLTTIVAFAPTIFSEGIFAPFPAAMGWVVILSLTFSLVESKWILPAHLAHSKPSTKGLWGEINKIQAFSNYRLKQFVDQRYTPFLKKCIANRYTTLAIFIAALIVTAGLVAGGLVRYVLIPDVPGDFINGKLEMVEGVADWQTREAHDHIAASLHRVNERYMRESGDDEGFIKHILSHGYDHRFAEFIVELTKVEQRSISSSDIVNQWREEVGDVPGAKILSLSQMDDMSGPAIGFKLIGNNIKVLEKAAIELTQRLHSYDGLYDIRNGASAAQDEIVLTIKPSAEALGISQLELGQQVRQAFYGAEAQRIQRGNNEIKVMVRYPRQDREAISNLENMYIRTQDGTEVPFTSVAEMSVQPGYTRITRINSQRAITVSAGANKGQVAPQKVVNDIRDNFMPELMKKYPGISYTLDGESEEEMKMLSSLFLGFALALFGIYALLAIPLKSYLQPLIIMGVIPFGIIGAIFGHLFMGLALSMMSFFGIIALSGVVVNDSLIMVDFVNQAVDEGKDKLTAVLESGAIRFRAIMLTSLTTFCGLFPMLLESSFQAQMMIPMAASLGFGIVFATVITLLLVPCLYMVLDDFSRLVGIRGRSQAAQPLQV